MIGNSGNVKFRGGGHKQVIHIFQNIALSFGNSIPGPQMSKYCKN